MAARRHLCSHPDYTCDNVATIWTCTGVYACTEHAPPVAGFALVDGFNPAIDSNEEIRAARRVLVKAGVIRVG